MIINLGPHLRIRSITDNWVVEAGLTYKNKKGEPYPLWKTRGCFTQLDTAFVHCGRHFLEQITGEFGTDALPALFELTDEYKRLGKEAVERLPGVGGE